MDEPMLKARAACSGASEDGGSAILSVGSNNRRQHSFLSSAFSGPLSLHLALCSLVLGLASLVMFAWLWRVEVPARVGVLEQRLEQFEVLFTEQKRALHLLRKEVQFASSRLESMSAYEAFRREEDIVPDFHANRQRIDFGDTSGSNLAYVGNNNGNVDDLRFSEYNSNKVRHDDDDDGGDGGRRLTDGLRPPSSPSLGNNPVSTAPPGVQV